MTPTCALHSLVDRHFTGRIRPQDERVMREHLPGCATCRERYERQLLLSRLDPRALDARTRLARGLGLDAREPLVPWSWGRWLVPVAVACLALFMVRVPWTSASDGTGFTARGGSGQASPERLVVYAVEPQGPAAPLGDTLRASQELAFAYRNPDAKRFLMVFARDAAGRVYWYYPSWTDAAQDPEAMPISGREAGDDALHELPEAISHPLEPGPLTLHAVFLDAPLTVRQMEALLAGTAVLPPDAVSTELPLQVVP